MAKNRYRHRGRKLYLSVAAINGTGTGDLVKSGDPGVVGRLPVVALTDEDADGMATCDTLGVYTFTVTSAVAAIAPGDAVHWDNAAGTLREAGAGVFFGTALGAVAAAGTATIEVRVGY